MALERLEGYAQEMMDYLEKQDLTYDEIYYILNYIERNFFMEMIEDTLQDYGLLPFDEDLQDYEEEMQEEDDDLDDEGKSDEKDDDKE